MAEEVVLLFELMVVMMMLMMLVVIVCRGNHRLAFRRHLSLPYLWIWRVVGIGT